MAVLASHSASSGTILAGQGGMPGSRLATQPLLARVRGSHPLSAPTDTSELSTTSAPGQDDEATGSPKSHHRVTSWVPRSLVACLLSTFYGLPAVVRVLVVLSGGVGTNMSPSSSRKWQSLLFLYFASFDLFSPRN